jgi:hypothetical protein
VVSGESGECFRVLGGLDSQCRGHFTVFEVRSFEPYKPRVLSFESWVLGFGSWFLSFGSEFGSGPQRIVVGGLE